MKILTEITERIEYLRSISPTGGKNVLDSLQAAINAYFQRDDEFTLDVNKCLDKIIADTFHYELVYQKMELLPKWLTKKAKSPPTGYRNIRRLFKGGIVFEEIMTISDEEFIKAFYTVNSGTGASGQGATIEYRNSYVDKWIAALETSKEEETEGLKKIMHYCANRSYGFEYAILFEELGKNLKRHSVRYYAKRIFLTRGWAWLIETFNLEIYRPSYMEELPNWTEEEEDINSEGDY